MKKLLVKIHEYDPTVNVLLISFAFNDSLKTVDEYTKYAFQPDLTKNIEDYIKSVAIAGMVIANRQQAAENPLPTSTFIDDLKKLEGKVQEFDTDSIIVPETNAII